MDGDGVVGIADFGLFRSEFGTAARTVKLPPGSHFARIRPAFGRYAA